MSQLTHISAGCGLLRMAFACLSGMASTGKWAQNAACEINDEDLAMPQMIGGSIASGYQRAVSDRSVYSLGDAFSGIEGTVSASFALGW